MVDYPFLCNFNFRGMLPDYFADEISYYEMLCKLYKFCSDLKACLVQVESNSKDYTDSVKNELLENISALANELTDIIEAFKTEQATTISEFETSEKKVVESYKSAYNERIDNIKTACENYTLTVKNELLSELEDLKTSLYVTIDTTDKNLQDQIVTLINRVETLENTITTKLNVLNTYVTDSMTSLEDEIKAKVEKVELSATYDASTFSMCINVTGV